MANFFIKRPIFAIVVALVITIAGALCIFSLPIDRYPKITPPQVSVHATYPGADSEVVAQTVAEVIEKNVVGAEGLIICLRHRTRMAPIRSRFSS